MESFAIVINIADSKNDAFIAMPFSKEFETLRKVIIESAIVADLKPRQLQLNPEHEDFLKGILEGTREAHIVVAVCSPERETGVSNPNVMYELGLAHSIGKSTVILTNNIKALPANLRGRDVLVYQDGKETGNGFQSELTNRMLSAMRRTTNGIILDEIKDISLAYARHQLVLNPKSWDNLMTILSFAKDVHHYFQDLDSNHLGSLAKAVDDIVDEYTVPSEQANDIQRYWALYDSDYCKVWTRFLAGIPNKKKQVTDAYKYLDGIADDTTKPLLEESKKFIDQIDKDLPEFQGLQEEIRGDIRKLKSLKKLLENYKDTQDLWPKMSELARIAKILVMNADMLILNMIELVK